MTCQLLLVVGLLSPGISAREGNEHQASVMEENEEAAVKAAVENFLVALGNDETEKVKAMMLPNANIASISIKDGVSKIYTTTAEAYLAQREEKVNRKFQEPVREYTVSISQGILAFVRADATVIYDGKPSHYTNDFFVLMKDNDGWKFLSGSYTTLPLEEEK